jgi:uncharacterized RmlC-like cupin family protein
MTASIRVLAPADLAAGAPTAGMVRNSAFEAAELWFGEVRTEPGVRSGWHHHGERTTYGYVVAGRLRFEFGPGGGQSVEAGPGDFFVVPPQTVHRESNPSTQEQVLVGARVGTGPSVVNVDGPDPAG